MMMIKKKCTSQHLDIERVITSGGSWRQHSELPLRSTKWPPDVSITPNSSCRFWQSQTIKHWWLNFKNNTMTVTVLKPSLQLNRLALIDSLRIHCDVASDTMTVISNLISREHDYMVSFLVADVIFVSISFYRCAQKPGTRRVPPLWGRKRTV